MSPVEVVAIALLGVLWLVVRQERRRASREQ